MLTPIKLYGETASDGSLTLITATVVKGFLHSVSWIKGTFANGVDFVLSVPAYDHAPALTLLDVDNADTDKMYHPRAEVCGTDGAELTYDGTNSIVDKFPVNGKLSLVIASGGDSKSGGCIVYLET